MELGNLMFGNSRGSVPIKRGKGYETELFRLFTVLGVDDVVNYDNDVFALFPYYWGDCNCGFAERWDIADETWCQENSHNPSCYQTELHQEMDEYDRVSGYAQIHEAAFGKNPTGFDMLFGRVPMIEEPVPGVIILQSQDPTIAHDLWCKAHDKRRAFEQKLYKRLMAKFDKPEHGCAVHCTCDYAAKRAEWCKTDSHAEECLLLKPNFLHKSTNLRIEWYKYPLRDAYFNDKCSLQQFRQIIDECIQSVLPTHS